jgi:hypothetical protein
MNIWEWKIYKLHRKLNARNPNLRKLKIIDSREINFSIIEGVKEAEEQRQEYMKAEKEYWIKRNIEFDRRLRQIEAKQAKEARKLFQKLKYSAKNQVE